MPYDLALEHTFSILDLGASAWCPTFLYIFVLVRIYKSIVVYIDVILS
jgi:hypothetical protein